ncbi:LAME_0G11188g1_1 [Lachancea meyersii CBS 8951]|uniref:Repressor of RNA polymerase III transcription MAF1 n=1 Tax=Lachancea meyersii CBS 8951 TaxID=1266667 RepID=A0A1G4K974_9SACH|nr:LAME_0G11188g1_1 [Lachancea meyersii CBS 8951]
MKFIDELDIELVNQTLNFETSDCTVNGSCDIFTTKAVASDKKLYKTIDRHLDSLLVENEGFNSAVQQQIALDNVDNLASSPTDHRTDTHQLYSTRGESGSPSSFWEQKRRISVSENNNTTNSGNSPNGFASKSYKLNDQNLKDLVNAESSGYVSSSSTESHPRANGALRRTSSSGSMAFGSSVQRRRSSAHKESVNIGPFGPINETASRRTFAYLIAILNASYPDHDFASLEPTDFVKSSMKSLISKFENTLISFGKQPQEWIWETINSHMDVSDCAIYRYKPSKSFLDDEPGHLWSLMWFLFNRKRKRVAFLYLSVFRLKSASSEDMIQSSLAEEDYDDQEKGASSTRHRRKLTIDHETNTFEGEYDLTCNSNDEVAIEDEDDAMEN